MPRLLSMMFVLAFASVSGLTTTAEAEPPRSLEGWGEVVDPAGDCQIRHDKNRLTIAIPGTMHDLSAEIGDTTAPRVLRDIEGDFIAQVKVSGNVRHTGRHTGPGPAGRYLPYHGAGLLILVDGRTYIRFERAAIARPDGVGGAHYANFELRKEGRRASGNSREVPDQDCYLRLERRGGQIIGSASQDGLRWVALKPIAVELPKRVKLGVVAVNTSSDPFKVEFTEWEVFIKEKGWANP